MAKSGVPKWLQEINSFKGIKSTFILEGNINDFYPIPAGGDSDQYRFTDMNRTLLFTFNSHIPDIDYDFMFCDPATGFYNPMDGKIGNLTEMMTKYDEIEQGEQTAYKKISDRIFNNSFKTDDIERLSNTIKNAMVDGSRERPIAIGRSLEPSTIAFFMVFERRSISSVLNELLKIRSLIFLYAVCSPCSISSYLVIISVRLPIFPSIGL